MPEVTYSTVMNLSVDKIWDFVQDMNNWAPFMTGYQSHEIKSDTQSIWTLKGDVGVLSRTVKLDVNITDWSGPNKVEFTLKGLNEDVTGGGTVTMEPFGSSAEPAPMVEAPRKGLWHRFVAWLMRAVLGEKGERRAEAPQVPERLGPRASLLKFRLRMDAGGPMAPMINAMLGPACTEAVEALGGSIAAHLGELHGIEGEVQAEVVEGEA